MSCVSLNRRSRRKKIEALEAAAPIAATPASLAEPEHPHIDPPLAAAEDEPDHHIDGRANDLATVAEPTAPLPIASAGDLHLYPPSTGLPQARTASSSGTSNEQTSASSSSSVTAVFDSIPPRTGTRGTYPWLM